MDAKLNGGPAFPTPCSTPGARSCRDDRRALSGSSEEHVMNRFQIIAGRWLAFIILPAAFWGGVALLFF